MINRFFSFNNLILVLGMILFSTTTTQAAPDQNSSLRQFRGQREVSLEKEDSSTLPQLPKIDRNFHLRQSRDGFLNPASRRQSSLTQVTSISELQDISPTEWAYEALRGLVERYGCIVGYPDRTFRGNRALSRYEFAAGLNACMNTIERLIQENVAVLREDIEKLKRLAQEFEQELMALGARVDNLESRVAFLEDHQFSTTTVLTGEFVVGLTGITSGQRNGGTEEVNKVTNFGYRGRLELNTTFTGNDLLYTRLATGTTPAYSDITGTFEGELGFSQPDDSDLAIELIIYEFDLAENIRMFIEPVGGAFDDFVPTVNFLDGDGASGAVSAFGTRNPLYYMAEGPGVGFQGRIFEVFEWSGGYLATDANDPDLGAGLFNGPYGLIGQFAYEPTDNFKLAFTYVHGYNNLDSGTGTRRSNFQSFIEEEFEDFEASVNTVNNSYGVELSWRIWDRFVFGGWGGFTSTRTLGAIDIGPDFDVVQRGKLDICNWAVTLAFPDAFKEGDTAGIIVGMEPWVSKADINLPEDFRRTDRDSSFHIEAIYQYPLNDNIAITPGIVVITEPDFDDRNEALVIGTIRTTFTF
ncbi:iron uptake porin [Crocosphaera sp. Alani8]|uniref:iron uptake porin n=1 Tax=Crocosphaera sp. Alani8 TaxID=3038952 RepID=UPI00313CCE49